MRALTLAVASVVLLAACSQAVTEESGSEVGSDTPVRLIGLPDEFVEHGSREELLAHCRLDLDGVRERVTALIETDDVGTNRATG